MANKNYTGPPPAFPTEIWVNIFERLSEEKNKPNPRIFHIRPQSDDVVFPERGIVELPDHHSDIMWSKPYPGERAITHVNKAMRVGALDYGDFIFGPGECDDVRDPPGTYFRWDSDILFLDSKFWLQHRRRWATGNKLFGDACDAWLTDGIPDSVAPDPDDYALPLIPSLRKDHAERIMHIGLPALLVGSEWWGDTLFKLVYEHFPNVRHFHIDGFEYADRAKYPRPTDPDEMIRVKYMSLGDKYANKVRKFPYPWEDPHFHPPGRILYDYFPQYARKCANSLRYKNLWQRVPDVQPQIYFRMMKFYHDTNTPLKWWEKRLLDPDSDFDMDSDFDVEAQAPYPPTT